MILTYIRSSLLGTWKICPHRAAIEYGLSIRPPKGAKEIYGELDYMRAEKAAAKGSLLHKILEGISHKKLCLQNGETTFEDDVLGTIHIKDCDVNKLFNMFLDHYKGECELEWTSWDESNVKKWVWTILKHNGGEFNPMKNKIVACEYFFDFPIDTEWARYSYKVGNKTIEDKLRLRGTCDLLVDLGDNLISIRDWKSGSIKNYVTGNDKTYHDLSTDSQFLLYKYVAKKLFPDKETIIEVFYARAGGPFTLYTDDKSIEDAENMLYKYFDEIRNTYPYPLAKNFNPDVCGFCPFKDLRAPNSQENACNFFEREFKEKPFDELFLRYSHLDNLQKYSGGGKEMDLSQKT